MSKIPKDRKANQIGDWIFRKASIQQTPTAGCLKDEMLVLHLLIKKRPPTSPHPPPDMSTPPECTRLALRLSRSTGRISGGPACERWGWGDAWISHGLSAGCLVAGLAEVGDGGTSPDAMSWNCSIFKHTPGLDHDQESHPYISKYTLIWIVVNTRDLIFSFNPLLVLWI
jgi:hypothetical protein